MRPEPYSQADKSRGIERRKTEAREHRRRNGHGSTKPGSSFNKCTERKRNQQRLLSPVIGQAAYRVLITSNLPGVDRDAVERDGPEHNPRNRESPNAAP